jgi:hypothetical protein
VNACLVFGGWLACLDPIGVLACSVCVREMLLLAPLSLARRIGWTFVSLIFVMDVAVSHRSGHIGASELVVHHALFLLENRGCMGAWLLKSGPLAARWSGSPCPL